MTSAVQLGTITTPPGELQFTEYNRYIPGLKNAIDWASQPWGPGLLPSLPDHRRMHRFDR